jgi:hypothetical protein
MSAKNTGILLRLTIVLIVFMVDRSWAVAGDRKTDAVLSTLRAAFTTARALPAGSRPDPPEAIDIDRLRQASPISVRSTLGRPTYQGRDLDCGASTCWAFEYGPRLQADSSARDLGNGLSEVTVVTGGPCLLLLGIEARTVRTVQWKGQK